MQLPKNAERLRIYTGENDHYKGRPVHEAIVEQARKSGFAGATVLRGIAGFGANSRVHTSKILRLSEDLPIITEIVDEPSKIDDFLPLLDEMIGEGLVVREQVQVLVYRHNDGKKK
ncbi:DUF190 domain-containing protein [Desulfovibrio ferrophilus]|uniref:Uncharacterized protein n=1 Tax=Desulfovibrio ferrophilus TaxID=241368 RepID=A0A2Z6AWA1_9BACT|nr:DUF190 domain-containing protein [Desulfovibrio ferrophilus]BBD07501.1 uncharacterized protein DFE_0775 [Desulfovibrio ferrophilus]